MKALAYGLGLLFAPLLAQAGVTVVPPSAETDAAYLPRRVALVIGVDGYQDPDLSTLSFAGKDANDIATLLTNQDVGSYDEVRVLTSLQDTDRKAILHHLEAITADLQRDDTFLLYLSGHGTLTLDPIDGTSLYFLPSDAKLDHPKERGIAVSWLEETVSELVPRRRVMIMDTCHNGRSKSGLSSSTKEKLSTLRGEPPAPNRVQEVTESEARLYAAQYHQPAMEDKNLKNGVYTHFLLKALTTHASTADLNADGLVDVTEAHDFAQEKTIRHTGGMQVPRAEYRIVGRESIFLAGDPSQRTRAENALISAYTGLLTSTRLFIDGTPRGSLPGLTPISPGRHKLVIETEDGRVLLDRSIQVRAGDHLQVENLLRPTRDRWSLVAGISAPLHASGALYTVPLQGDLEINWFPKAGNQLLQPNFLLRASAGRGVLGDQAADSAPGISGIATVGSGLGIAPSHWFLFGPTLDVGALWRQGTWFDEVHRQATPIVAPGVRAQVFFPIAQANELTVRYDVRSLIFPDQSGWSVAVSHGFSAGVTFR